MLAGWLDRSSASRTPSPRGFKGYILNYYVILVETKETGITHHASRFCSKRRLLVRKSPVYISHNISDNILPRGFQGYCLN